jgi:hypothetical protein
MLRAESTKGPGAGDTTARSRAGAGTGRSDREEPGPAQESTGQPREPRMNRIARRAHEIYEARGGQHGKAMDDWLQAEREVDTEMEAEGITQTRG